jgi:hypothetical protein
MPDHGGPGVGDGLGVGVGLAGFGGDVLFTLGGCCGTGLAVAGDALTCAAAGAAQNVTAMKKAIKEARRDMYSLRWTTCRD